MPQPSKFRFSLKMLLYFFLPLISTNLATIVLDTETDAGQNSGWSTVNCTYQEIYSELNQLQCKMRMMDGNSTGTRAFQGPAINMTGFWTPCQDSWCEVAYSFNSSSAFPQTVSVKGYVEGDASIGVLFGQRNDSENMIHLGNLRNNTKQWTETSFALENVTEDSVRFKKEIFRYIFMTQFRRFLLKTELGIPTDLNEWEHFGNPKLCTTTK